MDLELKDFLQSRVTYDKHLQTHTSKDVGGNVHNGAYHISDIDLEEFKRLYVKALEYGSFISMYEKVYEGQRLDNTWLKTCLVDFDYELTNEVVIPEGQAHVFSLDDIKEFLQAYVQAYASIRPLHKKVRMTWYVLMRPSHVTGKDGFHLLCNNYKLSVSDQMEIRQQLLQQPLKVFVQGAGLKEDMYDYNYPRHAPVQMYGSIKQNREPYKVVHIVDIERQLKSGLFTLKVREPVNSSDIMYWIDKLTVRGSIEFASYTVKRELNKGFLEDDFLSFVQRDKLDEGKVKSAYERIKRQKAGR